MTCRRLALIALLLSACAAPSDPHADPVPPLVCCTGPRSTTITRPRGPAPGVLQWRPQRGGTWREATPDAVDRKDLERWTLTGLRPGRRYAYRILEGEEPVATGGFVTARPPGAPFTCALIADPHVYLRDFTPDELAAHPLQKRFVDRCSSPDEALWIRRAERAYGRAVLPRVARHILEEEPDFLINLGDTLDLHGLGFNAPVPDAAWARKGWHTYRSLLGPLGSRCTHFLTLGNWDGEKDYFPEPARLAARRERHAWVPTPAADAGPHRDYYTFRWGDARFFVLNVISYTRSDYSLHRDGKGTGAEAHTLGMAQWAWLERVLAAAREPWKFICIHHPVGGRGGNEANSAYGRGGGRAARVGEQARLHALMRRRGVQILFHGHDHVFTDMVVDGIHYTLPGSCGAPWKFTGDKTGYRRWWPASGHARLRVEPARVRVTFISADREVLHSYTILRKQETTSPTNPQGHP